MNLIENITKFAHKNMPSWGVGIYRKSEGKYIIVEFEKAGIKKFTKNSINTTLMIIEDSVKVETEENKPSSAYTPVDSKKMSLIQFDGEVNSIAGKNVIEAFQCEDTVIFNETYIIIGEHTEALKIHAMYDLTIIGNVAVQECIVNGSLTIIGNARITKLTCYNGFICRGDLYSGKIYVGGDVIVDSIICDELICDGNVAIQTTININQVAQIGKTIVACEGIMGAGKFTALNAIANEYFEFAGKYEGKIVELETDTVINDSVSQKTTPCETIEESINLVNQKLVQEYKNFVSLDETQLLESLRILSAVENKELKNLPMMEPLFSKLVKISYLNKIENIEDYLTVLVAKQVLPDEIYSYESIDHIGKLLLPNAHDQIDKLNFEPISVGQFSKVLLMAVKLEEDLSEDWKVIMDKIFEAVGLKYSTVNSMIHRNRKKLCHIQNS